MNYPGLYIHIPFCKSKCLYCDFNSFANKDEYMAPYFSALLKEAKTWSEKLPGIVFDTMYFGGGTPSHVPPEMLCDCIKKLKEIFSFTNDPEITIECNPATIDRNGFDKLKLVGANRLSVGLQSPDDQALCRLGRIHSLKDFEQCFVSAREAGFKNISLDLMYALPEMTLSDWSKTIDKAVSFDAEHISAYALKIEEGTPFSRMKLNLPDDDESADMYELLVNKLRSAGYSRYEVSNFAKPGFESRHNSKYWICSDFLGIGAGAHSFIEGSRFFNHCDIKQYIDSIHKKGTAVAESEKVSENEQISEFVFLGLRRERGISISEFEVRFKKSIFDVFSSPIKKYVEWGFLILEDDRMQLSDKGFFVSNTIFSDFVL